MPMMRVMTSQMRMSSSLLDGSDVSYSSGSSTSTTVGAASSSVRSRMFHGAGTGALAVLLAGGGRSLVGGAAGSTGSGIIGRYSILYGGAGAIGRRLLPDADDAREDDAGTDATPGDPTDVVRCSVLTRLTCSPPALDGARLSGAGRAPGVPGVPGGEIDVGAAVRSITSRCPGSRFAGGVAVRNAGSAWNLLAVGSLRDGVIIGRCTGVTEALAGAAGTAGRAGLAIDGCVGGRGGPLSPCVSSAGAFEPEPLSCTMLPRLELLPLLPPLALGNDGAPSAGSSRLTRPTRRAADEAILE
eukprot:Unigene9304_Nuclearia_a/m.28410 Unigene9304_Nuclearia_a/g.28410  ORF Unigene9304_Nuclearia_a/g.28410 Unigene9304_Nuclearia_a/m.28410 type:complete len:300 (+) Unigene9304_Nuclearia_a:2643-3542(+)